MVMQLSQPGASDVVTEVLCVKRWAHRVLHTVNDHRGTNYLFQILLANVTYKHANSTIKYG